MLLALACVLSGPLVVSAVPSDDMAFGASTRPAESVDDRPLARWWEAMLWLVLLFIVFVVAALAIIRFSHRFKALLIQEARKPTADADVWQMHRLPEDEKSRPPGRTRDADEDGAV